LLKAIRHHTDCPWVLLYIERWLKAPVQMEDGNVVPRMFVARYLQLALALFAALTILAVCRRRHEATDLGRE
jgi:hypothetical protein